MISESHLARALTVLAEALVSERRVLVIGDSSLGLHELIHDLGARMIHVYDPDAARALSQTPPTARGTVLRGLPEGDFDVRDGAFDLAIVPDLASVPDAAALLARLRRVVGAEGAVMCAASNRDAEGATTKGLDYYELYDLVSLQFESVRMIAAMPFHGVTMAELGQDEVESAVRVDTQLAGERPSASAYVALASQIDVALDAYAVIELEAPEAAAAPESALRVTEIEAELAQARLRTSVLEAQVEGLAQARVAQARAEEEARRALDALEDERGRASRLERDLDAARRAAEAHEAAKAPAREVSDLAEQLAQAQIRAGALEEGVELAEKTIVAQRDRIAELEAAIAQAEEAAAIAAAAPPPPAPPAPPVETADEIAALEAKLRERGEKIAALQAELARREKLVKELVARLESGGAAVIDEDLHKKLDELALLAAHQKSELEARAWRIAELERAGGQSPQDSELEEARAELQKQAVLIEQLKTVGA